MRFTKLWGTNCPNKRTNIWSHHLTAAKEMDFFSSSYYMSVHQKGRFLVGPSNFFNHFSWCFTECIFSKLHVPLPITLCTLISYATVLCKFWSIHAIYWSIYAISSFLSFFFIVMYCHLIRWYLIIFHTPVGGKKQNKQYDHSPINSSWLP